MPSVAARVPRRQVQARPGKPKIVARAGLLHPIAGDVRGDELVGRGGEDHLAVAGRPVGRGGAQAAGLGVSEGDAPGAEPRQRTGRRRLVARTVREQELRRLTDPGVISGREGVRAFP